MKERINQNTHQNAYFIHYCATAKRADVCKERISQHKGHNIKCFVRFRFHHGIFTVYE
jgi:hypothetical protein